jgi:GMP synthase (glutamine-hydrolysing)
MRKLLVCQHVPHEILGTLNPLLKRAGFRIRYVNFGRHPDAEPSLERYYGLVVLGGPMSVNDEHRRPHLKTEMKLIEQALQKRIPVLGICLGAQLIAKVLGARVYPNDEKEIGWYDVHATEESKQDPVLGRFRATEKIFQWHGDTFENPAGAAHLAASNLCASQAFRYEPNVYGLQFHLEVDEAMIQRWLTVGENAKEIAALGGKIDPETIRAETRNHIQRLSRLSAQAFGEFIDLFPFEKTGRSLGAR